MIFGIGFVLYYVLICLHMRRWDSRFPRFWLALGAATILFEWKKDIFSEGALLGVRALECAFLALFFFVELLVLSGMYHGREAGECRYIIVLGAKVNGTRLTQALRRRLMRAEAYLKEHEDCRVVVSGGQGHGELITEARAMADYLAGCGIGKDRIFLEEHSTTTRENLVYSGRILLKEEGKTSLEELNVGIVTNDFHMYRAVRIAGQSGYRKIHALPAPTARIMLFNYMTREFFAVIKMWCYSAVHRSSDNIA